MKAIFKQVKANKNVAIKEVVQSGFLISEMAAGILYSLRDKKIDYQEDGLKGVMMKSLADNGYIEDIGSWMNEEFVITELGWRIINQIDARFLTRHGVKYGYDLFPFEANIPELKQVNLTR